MASVLRLGARRAVPSFSRSFSVSAASKKDLVQDLYLSQLKNYKPAPQAKADAGSVRNYTAPTPPQAPALPTDLAGELSKFDGEQPVIGAKAVKAVTAEEGGETAEEFLAFLEKDLPVHEEEHH